MCLSHRAASSQWTQRSSLNPTAQERSLQGSTLGNKIMKIRFIRHEIRSNSYVVGNPAVQQDTTGPSQRPEVCWHSAHCNEHCSPRHTLLMVPHQRAGPFQRALCCSTESSDCLMPCPRIEASWPVNWDPASNNWNKTRYFHNKLHQSTD